MNIPSNLHPELNSALQTWREKLAQQPAWDLADLHLEKVWACSPFIAKTCAQNPPLLDDLVSSGDLRQSYQNDSLRQRLDAMIGDNAEEEAEILRALRTWRKREMVRIAWRDLAGWADMRESFVDLTNLANSAIQFALDYYDKQLEARFGRPYNGGGIVQPLIVLGMGKLGGRELNFSSDIDLIFVYPNDGETQGGRKAVTNQEYFIRLGQKIIHALDANTADGFVFRVDMRLRPFGESGPLAMGFAPLEDYYQGHAREWERYALIKARPLTGGKAGEQLMRNLQPFVYRRYLDYGAFEALRDLKSQIDQEVRRKGHEDNIKLGIGGIREIEFICQAFQLIRGGRVPDLQTRHLLDTLDALEKHRLLPAQSVSELRDAYLFLRYTEHRLQAIQDSQTQRLPDDDVNRARLALAMNFSCWDDFSRALQTHQANAHRHYREVIVGEHEENATTQREAGPLAEVWQGELDESVIALLQKTGFEATETSFAALKTLKNSYSVRQLSRRGQQRLDALMPLLLDAVCKYHKPDTSLQRITKLLEAVARRSVYLSLLVDHPVALTQLVQLCADSDWIADQLTRYPLLLDELLDPRRLYDPLKPADLDNALQAQLAHLPMDDLELQMDTLRQFKRAQTLHIAAAELTGKINVELSSDYLTAIADAMLRQVLRMAWDDLARKHGIPICGTGDDARPAHFGIAAYGKAGGIEMSYASDLDIIFIHDSPGGATDGDKPLDNTVFFARLAKRIIHLLTTPTSGGILYEVDARLRPGGNSGLMVTSLDALRDYQTNEAWTWEHQALARARAVAGDTACTAGFEQIRRDVLQISRDEAELKQEVIKMREKMRRHLDKSNAERFDLKQGTGGITDIEFIVQYGVLRWARDYPDLLDTTGMLPMLQRFLTLDLLSATAVAALSDAYRAYRAETHRLALQSEKALAKVDKFTDLRDGVRDVWKTVLETE
jgi:glutamate-ammonia-ligase adenylyltransferase